MKVPKRKQHQRTNFAHKRKFTCPNCKSLLEVGNGHFVPPAFSDPGFFICTPLEAEKVINENFWELLA